LSDINAGAEVPFLTNDSVCRLVRVLLDNIGAEVSFLTDDRELGIFFMHLIIPHHPSPSLTIPHHSSVLKVLNWNHSLCTTTKEYSPRCFHPHQLVKNHNINFYILKIHFFYNDKRVKCKLLLLLWVFNNLQWKSQIKLLGVLK
jgi:hypothetical protein